MAALKRDDSFDAQLLPNLHSAWGKAKAWGTINRLHCKKAST